MSGVFRSRSFNFSEAVTDKSAADGRMSDQVVVVFVQRRRRREKCEDEAAVSSAAVHLCCPTGR